MVECMLSLKNRTSPTLTLERAFYQAASPFTPRITKSNIPSRFPSFVHGFPEHFRLNGAGQTCVSCMVRSGAVHSEVSNNRRAREERNSPRTTTPENRAAIKLRLRLRQAPKAVRRSKPICRQEVARHGCCRGHHSIMM